MKFFIFGLTDDGVSIIKKPGPEIFVQLHWIIDPSGSLEAEPSNAMLSIKLITWSAPATAIGGFFPLIQFAHGLSFLQALKIKAAITIAHVNC